MEEILYTGSVEDIAALVAAFKFPTQTYVLVENMPPHMVKERQNLLRLVKFYSLDDVTEITHFTSGRIFGKGFELRWDRASGKAQIVFLGEKATYENILLAIPGLEQDKEVLQNLDVQSRYYYLFGQLLDVNDRQHMSLPALKQGEEYYAEVRIPRLLRYPDPNPDSPQKAQRVQLAVREYSDKNTGQVKLFRFSGLRPAE